MPKGVRIIDAKLTVRVVGAATRRGHVPLTELSRLAGGLQGEVERIALVLTGGSSTGAGRRPSQITDQVQLEASRLGEGSFVMEVEPRDTAYQASLLEDEPLVVRCLSVLLEGIDHLRTDPGSLPAGFDRGVMTGLEELIRGIGTDVNTIELTLDDKTSVTLDAEAKETIREARRRQQQAPITVTGRLHMGDFAPSTQKCRIDTPTGSVRSDFDERLRDQVLDAMDQVVRAQGMGEYWGDEEQLRVLHLESLEVVTEAPEPTLEEILRDQGIRPIESASELRGEPIDGFDEFLEAIREART